MLHPLSPPPILGIYVLERCRQYDQYIFLNISKILIYLSQCRRIMFVLCIMSYELLHYVQNYFVLEFGSHLVTTYLSTYHSLTLLIFI